MSFTANSAPFPAADPPAVLSSITPKLSSARAAGLSTRKLRNTAVARSAGIRIIVSLFLPPGPGAERSMIGVKGPDEIVACDRRQTPRYVHARHSSSPTVSRHLPAHDRTSAR